MQLLNNLLSDLVIPPEPNEYSKFSSSGMLDSIICNYYSNIIPNRYGFPGK